MKWGITKSLKVFLTATIGLIPLSSYAQDKPMKIAIIKADDIRKETKNWQKFFTLSKKKGVKVSAGIICNSLEGNKKDYFEWLKGHQSSGDVEFWNHGWDHKRWETPEKKKLSEFSGSGYAHQKKHFSDSQAIMKSVLGTKPPAFGTPYNAVDADTVKVMNEDPAMRLFFCYSAKGKGLKNKVLAPMKFRGEHDGTGKPNFEKFKAEYLQKKSVTFSAIQFHPNAFTPQHFIEYSKILDYLISEGWTFMLPKEYLAIVD